MMQIVRKKLAAENLTPPGVRYNPTTDTVQTLVDGTWTDTPAADPRTSPGGLLPPRTGSTRKCDAAANMVAKVESIVNYTVASEDQASIVSTLVGFIALFLPGIGIVAEALWLLIDLVLSIGAATVASAFTSTFYDDLTCYFYCHSDSDGQLSADALSNVLSDVSTNYPGTVYNVFSNIIADIGIVGINNAGATGEETGDCSACTGCGWCYVFDFSVNDGGWSGRAGFSSYHDGAWHSTYDSVNHNTICSIKRTFSSAIVTSVTVDGNAGAAAGVGFRGVYFNDAATIPAGASHNLPTGAGDFLATVTYTITTDYIGMNVDVNGSNVDDFIRRVIVRGTGENPFGDNNCV